MPTKLCSFSPTDERISATMSGTWAAFSKSGGSQPPSWPSYNASGESAETVVVDAFADGRSIALEQGYRSEQCALWRKLWAR
jgi:carboxylesterase type B